MSTERNGQSGNGNANKPFTEAVSVESDAGSPVIHGSATGTDAAGVRVTDDQITALSAANEPLVA